MNHTYSSNAFRNKNVTKFPKFSSKTFKAIDASKELVKINKVISMKFFFFFFFQFLIFCDVLASYWVRNQSIITVILAIDIIFLEEKAWEQTRKGCSKLSNYIPNTNWYFIFSFFGKFLPAIFSEECDR